MELPTDPAMTPAEIKVAETSFAAGATSVPVAGETPALTDGEVQSGGKPPQSKAGDTPAAQGGNSDGSAEGVALPRPGEKTAVKPAEVGGKTALEIARETVAAEDTAAQQAVLAAEAKRLQAEQAKTAAAGGGAAVGTADLVPSITKTIADLPQVVEQIKGIEFKDTTEASGKNTVGGMFAQYEAILTCMDAIQEARRRMREEQSFTEQAKKAGIADVVEYVRKQRQEAQREAIYDGLDELGHTDAREIVADAEKFWPWVDKDPAIARLMDSNDPKKIDVALKAWRESQGLAMPAEIADARERQQAKRQRQTALHGSTLRQRGPVAPTSPTADAEPSEAEAQRFFEQGAKGATAA